MAIYKTLAAADPTNATKQKGVAIGHNGVGDALLASGNAAGAGAEYRASVAIAETQAAREPDSEWPFFLARAQRHLGDALLAQGDKAAARAAYQKAREIAQPIQARDPSNADVRQLLDALASKLAR